MMVRNGQWQLHNGGWQYYCSWNNVNCFWWRLLVVGWWRLVGHCVHHVLSDKFLWWTSNIVVLCIFCRNHHLSRQQTIGDTYVSIRYHLFELILMISSNKNINIYLSYFVTTFQTTILGLCIYSLLFWFTTVESNLATIICHYFSYLV